MTKETLTGNSITFAKVDAVAEKVNSIYEAVQELTKQMAELAKELKAFKDLYAKNSKAGRF